MAESRDAVKEHTMLTKVLSAVLEPPSPDLAELAEELKGEGAGMQLSTELVERVLMAKLAARTLLGDRMKYLKDCNKSCEDVRRDAKFPPIVLAQLPKVLHMLGNYGALSMTCAELFGAEHVPETQAAETLKAMWASGDLTFAFLGRIAEGVEEEEQATQLFGPLLTAVCQKLQGRDLADQKLAALNMITQACATKGPLARALVKLPVFRPPAGSAAPAPMMFPGMMPGQQGTPGEAYRLQTETLLGWVLSPTCLDTALYKEKSARQIHFQNITRKTRPQVASAQSLLRHAASDILLQATNLVNPLLRSGEETQTLVLEWFGALLTGTESRTKGANCLDQGGGASHFIQSMEGGDPMQQNLEMRLMQQMMQAKMTGFATPGMAISTLWCLLELVKPIKFAQAGDLDPYFILQEEVPAAKAILGGLFKETRFGDTDELEGAKELARAEGKIKDAKFKEKVFWLALKGIHVLLVPVIKEDFCFACAAGHFQGKDMAKFEASLGEHLLHETILDSSGFNTSLATMLNLEFAFCLISAFPDKAAEIVSGAFKGTILPKDVSPQWQVLPACILEDIVEILEYHINCRPPDKGVSEIFMLVNAELLLLLVTFMLGSGDHVKNPNLRGKATTILMYLAKQPNYLTLLENHPTLTGDIIPACIRVFTAVEKTKSSYFDIRMQLKYQLRIPIMELFERMLPLKKHKQALKSFATEHSDEFLKFLNIMMNDATFQLGEGLDTLAEVRKLVREGGEAALSRPAASDVSTDEQNAEGTDLYRQSRADPKEHCKTYMKMGNRTIRTLWSISREAPDVIVGKLNVLQQLLHNCLNSCLDRLVGPRCLELKGETKDFELFNFKPTELLQFIAEMYVFVARADKDRVQKMITEDGRSYSPKTFTTAVRILKRERVIGKEMLDEFEEFVQQLNALASSQEAAMANLDIPDNYLDPIMAEIMEDPVLLPTSQTIMDRKVIERHIMSNDDDPFNRAGLAVKDLVPQEELRAEIHAFCTKHGIVMGGADE